MANTKIIILKNTTAFDIGIVGILILAGGQADLSSIPVAELKEDTDLATLIANGDIVVNNGTIDLSPAGGDTHIRRDAQHSVWGTPYTDADQQLVDLPLGFNQSVFMSNGTASPPSWEWARMRVRQNGVNVPGMPFDFFDFVGPIVITNPTGREATIAINAETNTASNIGVGGVGVFDGKVGVDLQFKNINTGSTKITVTDDVINNEIDIDVDTSQININDLGDVDTTGVINNQVLTFNNISGNWEVSTPLGDQNIWLTVNADTGSTSANTTTDSLTIAGGTNISTTVVGDTLTITNTLGDPFQRAAVNSTTYTIVPTDTFIGVQHTTIASVTITLPLGSSVSLGRKISIKDEGGNASLNNITVNRSGSDTIDGDTGFIFSIDHGAIHVQWTGFEWSII